MAESTTVTTLRNKCVEIEHRISAYAREIKIARFRRSMAMKIVNTLDKLRIKGGNEKAEMRAGVIVRRMPSKTVA